MQDDYNNPIDASEVLCSLQVTGPNGDADNVAWACLPSPNGTSLLAAFYASRAGFYSLTVSLQRASSAAHSFGSQILAVSPGEPDSTRIGLLSTPAHADVKLFDLAAADAFGNVATTDCTGLLVSFPINLQ